MGYSGCLFLSESLGQTAPGSLEHALVMEEQYSERVHEMTTSAHIEMERMNSIENPGAFVRNANRVRDKLKHLQALQQRLLASH